MSIPKIICYQESVMKTEDDTYLYHRPSTIFLFLSAILQCSGTQHSLQSSASSRSNLSDHDKSDISNNHKSW